MKAKDPRMPPIVLRARNKQFFRTSTLGEGKTAGGRLTQLNKHIFLRNNNLQ
jgi:hypothetical protein